MRELRLILTAGLSLLPGLAQAAQHGFVKPVFLMPYAPDAQVYDYRPAINGKGTRIVFERSVPAEPGSKMTNGGYSETIDLYIADLNGPNFGPQRLVANMHSNRPDWCWYNTNPSLEGSIVFSTPDDGIFYTTANPQAGGSLTKVPRTDGKTIYPTWFPGCGSLAVYRSDALRYGPGPAQTGPDYYNPGPEVIEKDLTDGSSKSLSGRRLWAGFPSVNPVTPTLVAMAAQQFTMEGYNQDYNYIYIADTTASPPRVKPLDPEAPVNVYAPQYQGRAATWSFDGKWLAFESNRNCADKTFYAIFIENGQGTSPAQQVTACGYNAQHAKWYHKPQNGRTLLIVSVRLHPNDIGKNALRFNARGIAQLDVTDFVTP